MLIAFRKITLILCILKNFKNIITYVFYKDFKYNDQRRLKSIRQIHFKRWWIVEIMTPCRGAAHSRGYNVAEIMS